MTWERIIIEEDPEWQEYHLTLPVGVVKIWEREPNLWGVSYTVNGMRHMKMFEAVTSDLAKVKALKYVS